MLELNSSAVREVQTKLKALGLYNGPVDGLFGGGTEAAIKSFQKTKKLLVDGVVGPVTWQALFGDFFDKTPSKESLDYKCLALTGSIETGRLMPDCFSGLSGSFDGQGISYGALQWNFGQGSLQPLLEQMYERHLKLMSEVFHEYLPMLMQSLGTKQRSLAFASTIQHPIKHYVFEPWKGMFKTLGRLPEFQQIEVEFAKDIFQKALKMCHDFLLWSERAVALMFDICVQNGSIPGTVKSRILTSYKSLKDNGNREWLEVERMKIVINHRLEKVNVRWREDVKTRKCAIAMGAGTIHGIKYDLASQFGIKLEPFNVGV